MAKNMTQNKITVGILGASGYTGADLVRLLSRHPMVDIALLTADSNAGKSYKAVYPHLSYVDLPPIVTNKQADFSLCDVVFCGLPHGLSQDIVRQLPKQVKVIDLSADFRLQDPVTYEQWYNTKHTAHALQKQAVYGLTEHNREKIRSGRLIACPGCYPTATLLSLLPLARAGVISPEDIIIDAKSGVSGAGRKVTQKTLYCEVAEQMAPYAVANHRHAPEIEQELGRAFTRSDIVVNFTPHLVPLNRGELVTIYLKRADGVPHEKIVETLTSAYEREKFVHVVEDIPSSAMVKGSNFVAMSAREDRLPNRSILMCAIDNLVKGSSGQAIQNMNVMFGFDETLGLMQNPNFP